MMGILLDTPFPLYPHGFPPEIIEPFSAAIGHGVLGNVPASGTEIIVELGEEHLATGDPIVYTSGDSVFQVATHVSVVPLERLYAWCEIARGLLVGPHQVGRVIARPFDGAPGAFVRRPERRDYSVAPPGPTVLDHLVDAGRSVLGIGKIQDIFDHRGLTAAEYSSSNEDGVDRTVAALAPAAQTSSSRTLSTSTRSTDIATTPRGTPRRSRRSTDGSPSCVTRSATACCSSPETTDATPRPRRPITRVSGRRLWWPGAPGGRTTSGRVRRSRISVRRCSTSWGSPHRSRSARASPPT